MKKKITDELAAPPKHCSCGKPGTVIQVDVVHIPTGKTRRGVFSEFRVEGEKKRVLQPAFRLKEWLVFCGDCFCSQPKQEEMTD